jgi:hypothetical protein
MHLSGEQLKEVEMMASLFFSVEEIAVNLEIREVDELRAMFELREGEAYRAFQRGRLRTEAELRTAIRQAALNGSSPAQQMMISFLKSSEI